MPGRLTSRTIASGRRSRIAVSALGTSSASSSSMSTASSVARRSALSPGSSSTSKRRKALTPYLVSAALLGSAGEPYAFRPLSVPNSSARLRCSRALDGRPGNARASFWSAWQANALVDEEPLSGLAPEFSLLDVGFEQWRRCILVVAESLFQDIHDCDAGVEADQVCERQRPHRVRKAELRDRVDRLSLRDAVLERIDGLVDERHQDPVRDEAGEVVGDRRRLAELARELGERLGRLVGSLAAAHDLDELEHGHGIEEVHA